MGEQKESRPEVSEAGSTYDAPLVAPVLTRDVLRVLGEPVYCNQTYRDDERVTYTIESRDIHASPGEIRVTLKERNDAEPELIVDGTPAVGSGISLEIRGPVSDWSLAQTVDDHNLLTELVYQNDPVLSVYGPPAKLELDTIDIRGDTSGDLLIPDEHRGA